MTESYPLADKLKLEHCWTTYCPYSAQISRGSSQHGTRIHPTPPLPRPLCKNPICGIYLSFQQHHPRRLISNRSQVPSVKHHDRQVAVGKLGKITSNTWTISMLPACVLSPLPFPQWLHLESPIKLLIFCGCTQVIDRLFLVWSEQLRAGPTQDRGDDFRRSPSWLVSITILGTTVATADPVRLLGTMISQDLNWTSERLKHAQQRTSL